MQVFRLMNKPDRVIAFDELPERLLEGFEMIRADGFPRYWKEWLGKRKKTIKLPREIDPLTKTVIIHQPIIEEDAFFYLVDANLEPVMDKWREVCDFVKQHVSKETRLMDKIDDMAIPLASNQAEGVTLEPEDVPVIPIPVEFQEKSPKLAGPDGSEIKNEAKRKQPESIRVKCSEDGCPSEFEGPYAKNALRMHTMKRHSKEKVAV